MNARRTLGRVIGRPTLKSWVSWQTRRALNIKREQSKHRLTFQPTFVVFWPRTYNCWLILGPTFCCLVAASGRPPMYQYRTTGGKKDLPQGYNLKREACALLRIVTSTQSTRTSDRQVSVASVDLRAR